MSAHNEGLIRELSITLSGSAPILLRSGSTIPEDRSYSVRYYLGIANVSPNVIFLGGSTVTSTSGAPLSGSASIYTFPLSIGRGDLYAVSSNPGSGSGPGFVGTEVRILEA